MPADNPGEFSEISELFGNEALRELLIRVYEGGNDSAVLSSSEKIILGLRFNLIEGEYDDEPKNLEEIAERIYIYYGRNIPTGHIRSVLDIAETKATNFMWRVIRTAVNQYLGVGEDRL